MLTFLFIVIGLPFLGWFVGVSLFDALIGKEKENNQTFITHVHHYHDNRQLNIYPEDINKEIN